MFFIAFPSAEMGESITDGVGQMKETVVESVNGVANSIGEVINDGMTKIPLKDTMESTNHLLEENLENLKNEMMNKTQSIGDETDKIADELIKDTEDVIRDAETGIVDVKNKAIDTMESMKDGLMEDMNMNSPSHSIDTIQTSAPEPEIERILNGDDREESPEATVNELENLNKESNEAMASAPSEEPNMEEKSDEPEKVEEMPPKKVEDELVVEDIKDEWVKSSGRVTQRVAF